MHIHEDVNTYLATFPPTYVRTYPRMYHIRVRLQGGGS